MLPKEHRLKKNSDFVRVISGGTKSKIGPFLFFLNPGTEKMRVGVVVSKKVAKLAVVRNHIRRVIQHSLRENLDVIAERTGDGVIMVLSLPAEDMKATAQKAVDQWLKK